MLRKRFIIDLRGILIMLFLLINIQVSAQQKHSDALDDVLQYVPYATVVGLGLSGVDAKDDISTLLIASAGSWLVSAEIAWSLKHTIHEWRPDDSDQRSFPSGHSTIAFAGATMLHLEYGHYSPWVSVAGYGVATLTAVDRVLKDRHHWYDVAAGAGIGFLSAELTCCLTRRWLKKEKVSLAFTGNRLDVALRW